MGIKVIENTMVFINKSKIQFESYSQHNGVNTVETIRCLSINQRYNLKAIHNDTGYCEKQAFGVYQ